MLPTTLPSFLRPPDMTCRPSEVVPVRDDAGQG
jgi:hypothetical protein